jgi:predicted NUDIX family NTP pyrophosphohydrolase
MPKQSAGLLVYRRTRGPTEVLLAHPGGPFWVKKDEGAWSIPKGEINGDEDLQVAAKREFLEETNLAVEGPLVNLGSVRLKSGKVLHAWATEADPDLTPFASNLFEMEWPPRSGKKQEFAEVDRIQFFALPEARQKINVGQLEFLTRLEAVSG